MNSEGKQKITSRSANPGRSQERCSSSTEPEERPENGIAGPAHTLDTVVRIRARGKPCGGMLAFVSCGCTKNVSVSVGCIPLLLRGAYLSPQVLLVVVLNQSIYFRIL